MFCLFPDKFSRMRWIKKEAVLERIDFSKFRNFLYKSFSILLNIGSLKNLQYNAFYNQRKPFISFVWLMNSLEFINVENTHWNIDKPIQTLVLPDVQRYLLSDTYFSFWDLWRALSLALGPVRGLKCLWSWGSVPTQGCALGDLSRLGWHLHRAGHWHCLTAAGQGPGGCWSSCQLGTRMLDGPWRSFIIQQGKTLGKFKFGLISTSCWGLDQRPQEVPPNKNSSIVLLDKYQLVLP